MSYCISFLYCLPILFIICSLLWSYYMYVIILCINVIWDESVTKCVLYLVTYHILFVMLFVSYFKVMCTSIAIVPKNYKIPEKLIISLKTLNTDAEKNDILLDHCYDNRLTVITRNSRGFIRLWFCGLCKVIKPDRAHHCSSCKTCILKMDHHCPWINNCVCFSNYKFFIVFLFYISVYCFFLAGTILEYVVSISFRIPQTMSKSEFNYLAGFLIGACFSMILGGFLVYHLFLIARNKTTLEFIAKPIFRDDLEDTVTFDIGTCDNYGEVFGYTNILWFLPVYTSLGNGVTYPIKIK